MEAVYEADVAPQLKPDSSHYLMTLAQTVALRPVAKAVAFAYRTVKLLTWVPAIAGGYKVCGFHTEASAYLESESLSAAKTLRDFLFIPSLAKQAFWELFPNKECSVESLAKKTPRDYLSVNHTKGLQPYLSRLHGCGNFEVFYPQGIEEFTARSDAALKTVMVPHFLKPGMMAINFGCPNVSTFITKKSDDGSVDTFQVDAKSLWRAPLTYHPTHGKIQSGLFFVPTNIPDEVLERIENAARAMEGAERITCVRGNCEVLKKAGFSIENVEIDSVTLPVGLLENFLFRKVFYTDSTGIKHKVHFDIVKTTQHSFEKYFELVDTAVVCTWLRHSRRNAETEESREARGKAAQMLIAQEEKRLSITPLHPKINDEDLGQRTITTSVPSFIGNLIARIWGHHTMYEVDLADKKGEMVEAFKELAKKGEPVRLKPFPQRHPNLGTKIKRDWLFSKTMIQFLRRHMMGRVDKIQLKTQDLFEHLKATGEARLNYVLLDDKVVFARAHPRDNSAETIADWALSKHALLAGRQEVYCSGEIWYNKERSRFLINNDSGTYIPSHERVQLVAELANKFFDMPRFGSIFEPAVDNTV
ncbi:MAG: hypothetical protein JSR46_01120 [Verrucomicrobia bacterium]|nr:hypothetical protein [Verrucomicrobiota bacterium]